MNHQDGYHFDVFDHYSIVLKEIEGFVHSFPVTSLFQLPIWFQIKDGMFMATLKKDGQIVALLLAEKKRFLFDVMFGPLYHDVEEGALICQHMFQYLRKEGASFLRISPGFSTSQPNLEYQLKKRGFKISGLESYKTLITNLSESEIEIFKKISNHHKKAIKKSETNGLEVLISDDIELFLVNYSKFVEVYQLKFSPLHDTLYIRKLFFKFQSSGQLKMFFVIKNKEVIGGLAFFTIENKSYYAYGFSDKSAKVPVLHFCFWKAIMHFKDLGYNSLDWGGFEESKSDKRLDNIHLFKKRFGGEVFEYQKSFVLELKWFLKYEWFRKIKSLLSFWRNQFIAKK
ncbi:MAG: GNAT family N-acetyltransferase [Cytophagales bacterium]